MFNKKKVNINELFLGIFSCKISISSLYETFPEYEQTFFSFICLVKPGLVSRNHNFNSFCRKLYYPYILFQDVVANFRTKFYMIYYY